MKIAVLVGQHLPGMDVFTPTACGPADNGFHPVNSHHDHPFYGFLGVHINDPAVVRLLVKENHGLAIGRNSPQYQTKDNQAR